MSVENLKGFREECAVFGIWNDPEAAKMAYLGLYAQQHRGQESAGIVSLFENNHIHHKGLGLVGDVFHEADLERLKGQAAIGHTRYSTTGQNLLTNAQPLTAQLENGPIALAHNGNIVNSKQIRQNLRASGSIFYGTNDTECLLHLIAHAPTDDLIEAIKTSARKLVGAYSMVLLSHDRMIAIRDPLGFRPLILGTRPGEKGAATVIASETCAFDLIGAKYVREIEPGELFWVDAQGEHSVRFAEEAKSSKCVFEHVYFARPDSMVFGQSVYESRKRMGRILAEESPVPADIVIAVPDSGLPAAMGYAEAAGLPFEMGIVRNHYIGRTFIQPSESIRSFGVKIKLNPQAHVLKNKRVVVIDDSLVRGTTSQKIIRLIRQAGASEVHFRIASPPTVSPCFYGVDTPKRSQLIAARTSVEDIRKFIDADSLSYLSMGGLMRAVQGDRNTYCASCFDGKYPTELSDIEDL